MMPIGHTLARNVKLFAEQQRIGLAELASRGRMGRRTLGKILNGENINLETLANVARALRRPPHELLDPAQGVGEESASYGLTRITRLDAGDVPFTLPAEPSSAPTFIDVPPDWPRMSLGVDKPGSLRIRDMVGDALSPAINHGDIAFVDIDKQTFRGDGLYCFVYENRLLIRRLRNAGHGEVTIHSDHHAAYPPVVLNAEMVESLEICGTVVGWWQLRRS